MFYHARGWAETVRYLHLQPGEVASWIVKVAGWETSHSQFGYQPFLAAQDPPDCDVLKLQQVQSYLRDSTDQTSANESPVPRSKTMKKCCKKKTRAS